MKPWLGHNAEAVRRPNDGNLVTIDPQNSLRGGPGTRQHIDLDQQTNLKAKSSIDN